MPSWLIDLVEVDVDRAAGSDTQVLGLNPVDLGRQWVLERRRRQVEDAGRELPRVVVRENCSVKGCNAGRDQDRVGDVGTESPGGYGCGDGGARAVQSKAECSTHVVCATHGTDQAKLAGRVYRSLLRRGAQEE
jgi:hypothetical protein